MEATVVYTDGSCSPNPGDGGWAWVSYSFVGRVLIEYSDYGGCRCTTNNAMEGRALLEFLLDAVPGRSYDVYIDSIYTLRWVCDIKKLIGGADALAKSVPDSAPNAKVFQKIHKALRRHRLRGTKIVFFHVKGHSGDRGNDRADELANRGRLTCRQ